ncbi:tetratricopeptide repeat protein [Streptomyces asiaticus]|uniref:tetratricopeptide repeat protein n=1 Tax=Streptomyces asiaticus TaxID=114695 RepID=UPI003F67C125
MGNNYGTVITGDTTVQAPLVLSPPTDVHGPQGLHNLPRPAGHRFVGRETEMTLLDRALRPRTERAATQVLTQAMSGLGGVGKSTLALRFAHDRRPHYSAVWWINAETPGTITDSLAELTAAVNPEINTTTAASAALAQWALAWLDAHPGWLLVFDNATEPDHLAPYLARLTSGDHLITSRLTHGWDALAAQPLHLDVLTASAATSLLHQLAKVDHPAEHLAAAELANELGHLPLALEQAGVYIHRTRGTYSGYLQGLRTQAARMLNTPGNGAPHSTTIARTWRVTLDTIADRNPLAVHLLRVMAWFAPHDIPRDLLNGTADEPGTEIDALALLSDFSMITLTETTTAAHRLVQAVARTPDLEDPHRTEQAIKDAKSTAEILIRDALPNSPETNITGWPRWRTLLPHIDAYLTHTPPDSDTTDTALILYNASRFLHSQGQLSQATMYAQRSATTSTRLLGEDHPDTLTSRNNLAGAYQEAGDLGRAIPMYEQTLTDRVRILGEEHPDTLASRNNLAYAYWAAGDLGRATPLLKQTLTDRVRILGEEHPDTLASRNNLAGAYQEAGDLGRAIPLLKQTLTDRVRILGEEHPDTLASRHNLAYAYREAGDLGRAIPMYEQTLTDRVRILGEDHPDTLASRHNLAYAYREAGDLSRAIPLLKQTLTDHVRILGEDHPHTLASRNNLAYAYREAGDLSQAIPMYEQTLTDSIRILGEDHPTAHTVRNNLRQARSNPP